MTFSTVKDPAAVLDYKFDWANTTNGGSKADWLESGETISSHTVTASTGLTVDSSSITDTNTSVTAWLSGGTAGEIYTVVCQVVTNSSPARTDERTLAVKVQER